MTTTTQRKKGWWKIWVGIGVFAAIFAIIGVLAALGIVDLAPWADGYMGVFMWGSESVINSAILTALGIGIGLLGGYLYYNYLRGQKTTNPTGTYVPQGQTIPQQQQQNTETVIS